MTVVCLTLTAILASPMAPAQEASLATQLAYRIDRELGAVDGAQRHLLAWRLWSALDSGEFKPGTAVTEILLSWQQNLERLENAAPVTLPAWFAPLPDNVASDLMLAWIADPEYAPWHRSQRLASAARLAPIVTSDTPPDWALVQHPRLLAWARDHAPWIWSRLLEYIEENPDWMPLLEPAVSHWTALPLDAGAEAWAALDDLAAAELRRLRQPVGDPALAILRAEAELLDSEALLVERFRAESAPLASYQLYRNARLPTDFDLALLALSRAVAGVEQGEFVQLVEVLASLTQIVLLQPESIDPQRTAQVVELLRATDPIILQQLEAVDPGLQAVYLQLRRLMADAAAARDAPANLRLVASLRAALRMDTSDLEGYLSQPMRTALENDLLVCFDISRGTGPRPREPIALSQYQSCQSSFLRWATETAMSPELAGEASGPFEIANLERELELSPWQRVNYWTGYLADQLGEECELDLELVNALEWAVAANAYVVFAQRWPAYFQATDSSEQIDRMLGAGQRLVAALTPLSRCGSGTSPLMAAAAEYAEALDETVVQLAAATQDFRATRLVPGADIRLDGDAWQVTNYRPESLQVVPCGNQAVCNVSQPLTPSRALFSLLPSPFLVADQVRVGSLQLCYDQIRWEDRRAELAKVGNPAMARYFGRLSFELHARMAGVEEPILSMRLTSDEEYEYLFGENAQSVLDDPCPRALIGTQVRATMPERMINLVPRRLTFMTADRADPAKILEAHWAQGSEWRDRFVTGEGVELLASRSAESIVDAVNARLADLFRDWNAQIYDQLLSGGADSALAEAMNRLDTDRRLISTLAKLLAPRQGVSDPATRAALVGAQGLFDRSVARRLRQQGVPVSQIPALALGHYEDARYLFLASRPERVVADPLVSGTLARLAALRSVAPLSLAGQN